MYLGPYRDGGGYCEAARNYILALDAAGVDVVPRAIKLNEADDQPPNRLLGLERKSARGCDAAIIHCLPPHFLKTELRSIGLFACETSNFRASGWQDYCNLMDEVWVPCRHNLMASRESGVTAPTHVVPHAFDVNDYLGGYPESGLLKPYKDRGEFLFYTIGEFHRRKNFAALLRAFHAEFDLAEPVRLVIKTGRYGADPAKLRDEVKDFCQKTRDGLKIRRDYTDEVVLTEPLPRQEVLRLHSTADCYVSTSYGEAWGIGAFEAMAMGKTPILSGIGGHVQFASNRVGWMIPAYPEHVFGMLGGIPNLYTGREIWGSVDVGELRVAMRSAYEQDSLRRKKAEAGRLRALDFSLEKVGGLMKGLLDGQEEVPRSPVPAGPP